MTTTTCPNCGKPLRPGARFCGNCGATVPPTLPEATPSTVETPAIYPCPHCGKPVRSGAKFCTHCGKEVLQESEKQPFSAARVHPAVSSSSKIGSAEAVPAARSKPLAAPAIGSKPRRRPIWPLVFIGILLICGIGSAGGYLYLQDPFNWLRTATPSREGIIPSMTVPPSVTQIPVISTTTHTPIQASPSAAIVLATATISPSLPPVISITPTTQVTSSVTLTSTVASFVGLPTESTIFEDDFDEALNVNWLAWGNPRPTIRNGFGDNWLELKAADVPSAAGVTSRVEIANSEDTTIEFAAQLNPGFPNYPLFFDWDPIQIQRGPQNPDPTVVHLEIRKNLILMQAPAANNSCPLNMDGTKHHDYFIKFLAEKIVELYIDSSEQPLCKLNMGIIPVSGKISFTGSGWVTLVHVIGADLP